MFEELINTKKRGRPKKKQKDNMKRTFAITINNIYRLNKASWKLEKTRNDICNEALKQYFDKYKIINFFL